MITTEQYMKYAEAERKRMIESGFFRSTPQFLFALEADPFDPEEWTFNKDNWNGCDILRRFLYADHALPKGIEIKEYKIDDTTYIFIFTPGSFYEISWYKQRGRTDYIRKDGEPITMDEYIDLCNQLGVELTD